MTIQVKRGILTLLTLLLCAALASAWAAEDAIRVSSRSDPQSVISEREVDITIKVYNTGAEDVTGEITIFNSEGNSVEQYPGLKAGQTVTYEGKWNVTAEQISQGKILFYIRYPASEPGAEAPVRQIPITIQKEEAVPQLTATYTISPATARPGQQVTASYTLSNTGNIELRGIEISNPGFSAKTLTAAALSVGERVQLTDTVMMGEQELISDPVITYTSAGSTKKQTQSDLGRRTVTVSQNGLIASLSSDNAENVYPGAAVTLDLSLRNTGDEAISEIVVRLPDGSSVSDLHELRAGGSFETSAPYVPSAGGAVSATVSGTLPDGEEVTVVTNEVPITMQDASTALLLRVRAKAETDTIYSEPGTVRFAVEVENVGDVDAANLTITEAGTKVAVIPSLQSGEKKTAVLDLSLSMAGTVRFAVSGKDAIGNERTYESGDIVIAYVVPTPTPTAAPTPTPVPPTPTPVPTPTPEPTLTERLTEAIEEVDPIILIAAGAAIGVLILFFAGRAILRSSRRRKKLREAVDTLDTTSDARNSFGTAARGHRTKERPEEKDDSLVSTTELTEEDLKADPVREEGKRRRSEKTAPVPEGKTLRVSASENHLAGSERPEPGNSPTRVYSPVHPREEAEEASEPTRRMEPVTERHPTEPPTGDTVRLSRMSDNEHSEQDREEAGQSGKRRGLFGRRKEDVIEDGTDEDADLYD